ncbi:VirB4 family type IV secretion/conjugal transfer ATPase [Massilia sp. NEAU-DD11]|uniref:VirB4 family type IV secretion/conjugal transfer ATPase n=1 Tax=Massilia cellulosiltytica TaxID=2683234 RepID=A0A7X3G6J2_9BURK|nr:VirB4 family type IV secretion/conjugal transfer ATPase [Telluria cellulosilytica]MVW64468.1 VirB4 family type IV secretion/conjugal transfer ATPase [Telluria cellulosilytica]
MVRAAFKYADAAQKEEAIGKDFIPYAGHVTKTVVKLKTGDYMMTFRLQGAAHESADAQDINIWHDQLNNLIKNIASPHVALWSHVVRREYSEYPGGHFEPGFASDLNEKYRVHLAGQRSLINELYVSVIYRPQPVKVLKMFDFFGKKAMEELAEEQRDELEVLQEIVDTALAGLDRYEPEVLGCYERNGVVFSELREFLAFLIDGEWRRQPLTYAELAENLATSRPLFGKGGLLALKGPILTQYGAILGIQDYTSMTCPGLMNDLLSMPFEFVLSQSFTFLSKPVALGRMKRQHARMVNAGDVAVSQVDAIETAMDELMSGKIVMGVHNFVLFIRATEQKALAEHIGDAGNVLSDAGMKWYREDVGLAGSFYAQLPGNFAFRVNVGDISSRNFAGFSSFHNYPIGHIRHNQWGHAVTAFRTTSGAPYYFNWHKGEDGFEAKRAAALDPNHKDLANTIVIGKSGTGKTALQMFLLAQSLKFNNSQQKGGNKLAAVFFDKDLGASVGIRALGGRYFPLKNGMPSGWNPFQLEPNERNLMFLEKLVRRCAFRADRPFTPSDEKTIFNAIQGVMSTPQPMRRFSAVLQFLPMGDPEGIHARLSRWAGRNAPLGWLFDNAEDTLSIDDTPILGFDVTEFLPNDETREPTMMYLFHRIETLLDGRRVPIFFDEFGQLSKDATMRELVENKLVTIRKQDGFLIMGTQMPGQVIKSPIADAIIQQTATKIFLPNPEADRDEYVNGFKLTEREFQIIKDFGEKSRLFLVKQGGNSVVAEFKLRGFDDELAVLSGNTATSNLVERLVAEIGNDPACWLPEFHRIRKGKAEPQKTTQVIDSSSPEKATAQ